MRFVRNLFITLVFGVLFLIFAALETVGAYGLEHLLIALRLSAQGYHRDKVGELMGLICVVLVACVLVALAMTASRRKDDAQ